MTLTLYDAERCPYCARVRIVLAEKRVPYDVVTVDLDERPAWIYEKNPLGRVPVLEEGDFLLPESDVITTYLEERYPEPPLLPPDPADRALARLLIHRFDRVGEVYYALWRGDEDARPRLYRRLGELDSRLAFRPFLTGDAFGLADVAYVPWVLRAETRMGIDLSSLPHLREWVQRLLERPSVAAESELVATL